MYSVFVTKTRHKPVFCDNGKIIVIGKEMSKLFLCDYFTTHYNIIVRANVEKKLIIILQEEKNDGFGLRWGTFNEYIQQDIIMGVLRKADLHSVDIWRLMKNL